MDEVYVGSKTFIKIWRALSFILWCFLVNKSNSCQNAKVKYLWVARPVLQSYLIWKDNYANCRQSLVYELPWGYSFSKDSLSIQELPFPVGQNQKDYDLFRKKVDNILAIAYKGRHPSRCVYKIPHIKVLYTKVQLKVQACLIGMRKEGSSFYIFFW